MGMSWRSPHGSKSQKNETMCNENGAGSSEQAFGFIFFYSASSKEHKQQITSTNTKSNDALQIEIKVLVDGHNLCIEQHTSMLCGAVHNL